MASLLLPVGFYLAVSGFSLALARGFYALSLTTLASLFFAGIWVWTLVEYLFHRYVYHFLVERSAGRNKFVTLWYNHRLHHENPERIEDVITQIPYSLPVALVLTALLFATTRSFPITLAVLPGMLVGYLYYEWVHFSVHFLPARTPWRKWQKENHLRHHNGEEKRRFGVTSPLWDLVCRTG